MGYCKDEGHREVLSYCVRFYLYRIFMKGHGKGIVFCVCDWEISILGLAGLNRLVQCFKIEVNLAS